MTPYLSPWLLFFLVISILFIALVEVIRRELGNTVLIWQTIASIIAFWLSSYALFFILDSFTYLKYRNAFVMVRTPINAVFILAITASIWFTATSNTPVKSPLPITFLLIGFLSVTIVYPIGGLQRCGLQGYCWNQSGVVYFGFGLFLILTGFVSGIIAALYFAGKTTVPTSLTPMLRAGAQIFSGAIILLVIHLLFVLSELTGWSFIRWGLLANYLSYLNRFLIEEGVYLFVTIIPLGWLLIGLGYQQFHHQDRIANTKAELHTFTDWTHKSGTVLIGFAITSLIFSILLSPLNILSWLFLISIALQFFIGVRLRMWNTPDFSLPAETMIPGR